MNNDKNKIGDSQMKQSYLYNMSNLDNNNNNNNDNNLNSVNR